MRVSCTISEIRLENFITFSTATFLPGIGLNVIVGPNGSGKSSLVCAICLGLGWSPKVLGREKEAFEFIKRGEREATVKIILTIGRPAGMLSLKRVIRRKSSHYLMNGKSCSEKQFKEIMNSLNIQLDNLCMFLPQERIPEFSALSKGMLLRETMLSLEPTLFHYFAKICDLETRREKLAADLSTKHQLSQSLNYHATRYREEAGFVSECFRLIFAMKILKACIAVKVWANSITQIKLLLGTNHEYRDSLLRASSVGSNNGGDEKARNEVRSLQVLLLGHGNLQDQQLDRIVAVLQEYDRITKVETYFSVQSFRTEQIHLQANICRVLRNIPTLGQPESAHNLSDSGPLTLAESKEKRRTISLLENKINELKSQILAREAELLEKNAESGPAQRLRELRKVSPHTERSLRLIDRTKSCFEAPICEPPALVVAVNPARYANAVESLLSMNSLLTFTVSTFDDYKKLQDILFAEKDDAITAINIRYIPPEVIFACDSEQVISSSLDTLTDLPWACGLGFDGWAASFLEGPRPVKDMLCKEHQLHRIGIGSTALNHVHEATLIQAKVSKWIIADDIYQTNKRSEYGPAASSVRIYPVRKARFFDKPTIAVENRASIDLKDLRNKLRDMEVHSGNLKDAASILMVTSRYAQPVHNQRSHTTNNTAKKLVEIRAVALQRRRVLHLWQAALDKAFRNALEGVRESSHLFLDTRSMCCSFDTVLKLKLSLISASSKAYSTSTDSTRRRFELRGFVKEMKNNLTSALSISLKLRVLAKTAFLSALANQRILVDGARFVGARLSGAEIVSSLQTSQSRKLTQRRPKYNVVTRLKEVETSRHLLNLHVAAAKDKQQQISATLSSLQDLWERKLDSALVRVDKTFSSHLRSLGCNGSVHIVKGENIRDWLLDLKVGFRGEGNLHVLDTQRQSGGERAITTISYFLALQPLISFPFRVVDEINQGMDEVNERWAHSRILNSVSKGRKCQLFLITPKLLQELDYDERVSIQVIYTGDWLQTA